MAAGLLRRGCGHLAGREQWRIAGGAGDEGLVLPEAAPGFEDRDALVDPGVKLLEFARDERVVVGVERRKEVVLGMVGEVEMKTVDPGGDDHAGGAADGIDVFAERVVEMI